MRSPRVRCCIFPPGPPGSTWYVWMGFGFRCCSPAHRPHPASLPVRVPAVVGLPSASFSFTSRLRLAVRLGLVPSPPLGSSSLRYSPCRAHERRLSCRRLGPAAFLPPDSGGTKGTRRKRGNGRVGDKNVPPPVGRLEIAPPGTLRSNHLSGSRSTMNHHLKFFLPCLCSGCPACNGRSPTTPPSPILPNAARAPSPAPPWGSTPRNSTTCTTAASSSRGPHLPGRAR